MIATLAALTKLAALFVPPAPAFPPRLRLMVVRLDATLDIDATESSCIAQAMVMGATFEEGKLVAREMGF